MLAEYPGSQIVLDTGRHLSSSRGGNHISGARITVCDILIPVPIMRISSMTCDYGRPNCFPRSEEKASKENVSFTPLQTVCLKVALEPCGKGQLAQAAPKQSAKKKRGQKPKAGAKKSGKEKAQSAQSPQVVSVDARLTCLHPMSEWMGEWMGGWADGRMGGLFYFWLGF